MEAARSADVVVHAGATSDSDFALVDTAVTEKMLLALAHTGKTFIYTSGSWVLGNTGDDAGDEDASPNPLPSVQFRAALEQHIRSAKDTGIRTIVIRPGLVYGRRSGIVAGFVRQARQDGVVRYVGHGNNRVSVVHIDDLASLYLLAAQKGTAGAVCHGVSGTTLTFRALADAVAILAGLPPEKVESWPVDEARKVIGPYADGFLLDQNLDSTKTQAALGWVPRRSDVAHELAQETAAAIPL